MPQHEVWSPAARAVLLMMFKEYISAAAEFLIIRQVSMTSTTAVSPRESKLPPCSCLLKHWPFLLHNDTNEICRTPWAVTKEGFPSARSRLGRQLCYTGVGPQRAQDEAPDQPAAGIRKQGLMQSWDSANTPAQKRDLLDHRTDLLLLQRKTYLPC